MKIMSNQHQILSLKFISEIESDYEDDFMDLYNDAELRDKDEPALHNTIAVIELEFNESEVDVVEVFPTAASLPIASTSSGALTTTPLESHSQSPLELAAAPVSSESDRAKNKKNS